MVDDPRPIHDATRREVLAAFLGRNFVPFISVLVRRRCFDDVGFFDEEIRSGVDDFDWCVRLALRYRLAHVDEVLVTRREHEGNYTDPTRFLGDDLRVLDRIVLEEPGLEPRRRRRHARLLFECGRWWHLKGDRARARRAYSASLAIVPWNVESLAALVLLYTGPVGRATHSLYRRIRYGKN